MNLSILSLSIFLTRFFEGCKLTKMQSLLLECSPKPILRSESEFRGVLPKKRDPLPFRLRPYKVTKIDENNCQNSSSKIIKTRKNKTTGQLGPPSSYCPLLSLKQNLRMPLRHCQGPVGSTGCPLYSLDKGQSWASLGYNDLLSTKTVRKYNLEECLHCRSGIVWTDNRKVRQLLLSWVFFEQKWMHDQQ
jgi:hypothetical protein